MVKRKAVDPLHEERPTKSTRLIADRISNLSDELLLRILSFVPTATLATCHRVSNRFKTIASDSELWKGAYYERFIRPKTLRHFAGKRRHARLQSKLGKWLDEQDLVRGGKKTNWKRQYKIRHNWATGSCDLSEIHVAARPPVPTPLAQLHEGIVFSVDSEFGLRAWSYKTEQKLLATLALQCERESHDGRTRPTTLALSSEAPTADIVWIAVGFESGAFGMYSYDKTQGRFSHAYNHPSSSNGTLSALAFTPPYLLSVTANNILSVYKFRLSAFVKPSQTMEPPMLLASLKSHTMWPPLAVALRSHDANLVASVAYCSPTYLSGWSTGIQEVMLTPGGEILDSRVASALPQGFTSIAQPENIMATHRTGLGIRPLQSKPTSLSYAHPYLLLSNSDNTLTVHLVRSTAAALSIGSGRKLWGHTSSIFTAQIGARGKAVSVSVRGNEVRVWDLEGGRALASESDDLPFTEAGTRIFAERKSASLHSGFEIPCLDDVDDVAVSRTGSPFFAPSSDDDLAVTRGWVGFDEENVMVLREHQQGNQSLMVYDFT